MCIAIKYLVKISKCIYRYLHVCILLYRPLLVFYFTLEESVNYQHTDNTTPTDLQKSLFVQSSQKCVMIAQDLIKTISHNIKAQLPAWWYSIFCKFFFY